MQVIYIADHGGHFAEGISEYEKRLKSTISFTKIRPVKHSDRLYVMRQETLKVVEILEKSGKKAVVLDELGKNYTTMGLAAKLRKNLDTGEDPVFVIGGSFWFDRELLVPYAAETLALSEFTLPHSLALLVLLEQLYRIHEIWKGSKYHHQ